MGTVALFFLHKTPTQQTGKQPRCCYFFTQARPDSVAAVPRTVPHGKEPGHRCSQGACPAPSEIFFTGKTRRGIQKKHAAPIRPWLQRRHAEAAVIQKSSGQERQAPPKEAAPKTRIKAAGSAAGRLKSAAADAPAHGRGWPGNRHKKASHKKKRGRHARTQGAPHMQRRYVRAAAPHAQNRGMLQVQEGDR